MHMDLNKVELIGRLTADPDVRATAKGASRTSLRVAINRRLSGVGKSGEHAEFHSVVFFGRLAAVAGKYLKKGDRLFVSGRLQTNVWKTREGAQRSTVEVIADNLILLGGKAKADQEPHHEDIVVEEIEADEKREG